MNLNSCWLPASLPSHRSTDTGLIGATGTAHMPVTTTLDPLFPASLPIDGTATGIPALFLSEVRFI